MSITEDRKAAFWHVSRNQKSPTKLIILFMCMLSGRDNRDLKEHMTDVLHTIKVDNSASKRMTVNVE